MRTILFLLLFIAFSFAQYSVHVWKYEDANGNVRSSWDASNTALHLNESSSGSLLSAPFNPTKYGKYNYNGLLGLGVSVDYVSGDSVSFQLQYYDGIEWVDVNENLTFWKANSSSTTTSSFGTMQDNDHYLFKTNPSDDYEQGFPFYNYRVKLIWDAAAESYIKMTWNAY